MSDQTFQKLEEKVLAMLAELAAQRKEVKSLRQENATFKKEKAESSQKLQDLIKALDQVGTAEKAEKQPA